MCLSIKSFSDFSQWTISYSDECGEMSIQTTCMAWMRTSHSRSIFFSISKKNLIDGVGGRSSTLIKIAYRIFKRLVCVTSERCHESKCDNNDKNEEKMYNVHCAHTHKSIYIYIYTPCTISEAPGAHAMKVLIKSFRFRFVAIQRRRNSLFIRNKLVTSVSQSCLWFKCDKFACSD